MSTRRKLYTLLIILFLLLQLGCVKKNVYYPVPFTMAESFNVTAQPDGAFESTVIFPASLIRQTVQESLSDVSDATVNNIYLEAVVYTILQTNNPNTEFSGAVDVSYESSPPETLLDIEDVKFGDILNIEQTLNLGDEAVNLISQALQDVVLNNKSENLIIQTSGTVAPSQANLTFTMELKLTLNTVVNNCQEIFDPLGDDDPGCD